MGVTEQLDDSIASLAAGLGIKFSGPAWKVPCQSALYSCTLVSRQCARCSLTGHVTGRCSSKGWCAGVGS